MAKKKKAPKRKLTKAERREKYTKLARDRRDKAAGRKYNSNKICLNCRRKGHVVADCPNRKNKSDDADFQPSRNICFKCGSDEHSLKMCKKLNQDEKALIQKGGRMNYALFDLPHASCFICKQKGHLSGQCDQNENGLYVKGGCCRHCGSKRHLNQDCPELKKNQKAEESDEESAGDVGEFLEEDDVASKPSSAKPEKKKKKKVVNF